MRGSGGAFSNTEGADSGWSRRIGRIAGIDLYVHFTFVLLLAWAVVSHFTAHGEAGEAILGLAFILALFGVVVLHQLGHALAARRFGVRTCDIILLPIGGVARLDRMPEERWQEMVAAVAGPAVMGRGLSATTNA